MSTAAVSYRDILQFWLGCAPLSPDVLEERHKLWYGADESIDALIGERFRVLVEDALSGGYTHWEDTAVSRLALIIVLDQFTRNINRGRAEAFAGDPRAVALALDAIERGMDKEVGLIERGFFYLPLQHAEDLSTQQRCVEVSERHDADCRAAFESFEGQSVKHAREHRDIVARFGRFPHRNEALGRTSTDEELTYLADGAPDFGQTGAAD